MKRLIFCLCSFLMGCGIASAQPKSFGVRVGPGLEMSYQHGLGTKTFLEVDAGVHGISDYPGWRLSSNFDFVLMTKRTDSGTFDMFLGPGFGMGLYDNARFVFGVTLQYGVSYSFEKIPLNIAVDIRPSANFTGDGATVRWPSLMPALSLRWRY